MDLDLRLVRYFVAVAEELHFGRAAARLYISQPALSKQVRRLEQQIGAPLLVRDSRHVTLTPQGDRFLARARELLAMAEGMQADGAAGLLRIAHIFELDTSRAVADAFAVHRPEVRLEERAMDSVSQLRALLGHRLDVAMIRITAGMLAEHPRGWQHRVLRLEPMRLVGRVGEPARATVSLHERPIEVFGDAPSSGLYNAHGDYLTAFERHTEITMRWLGTPGAFSHCLAHRVRSGGRSFSLEFDSYAARYAAAGLPSHGIIELQPHYAWSIAWRDGTLSAPVHDFVTVALQTADRHGWQQFSPDGDSPWLPDDDPVWAELPA